MRILVLGGTRFVGRHLVQAAQERDHEVTLFNRGQSNPGLFDGVTELHGDRDGGLDVLAGRSWDAVIDTCGYVPRVVRASAEFLSGAAGHYTFISSISVYDDLGRPGVDETAPVGTLEDETTEEVTGKTYGPLKALCERAVSAVYADGGLIIRPGLIVGPYDPTDRFTYWPVRVDQGGEVLASGEPHNPVQFIDARDLADWTVAMVERKATGVYNATGPAERLPLGRVLETCRAVTGSDVSFTWADEEFLLAQDAEPWREFPLWLPGDEGIGFGTVNISRALANGLRFRPLAATIADTLSWAEQRSADHVWRAGLAPEKEAALLQAWHERRRG
ncbi:MAG: SDR family oxidoreductase [Anaerolineae bacterium]|nr:SDR family oxidoreductase [Anaerolineae bacterium]